MKAVHTIGSHKIVTGQLTNAPVKVEAIQEAATEFVRPQNMTEVLKIVAAEIIAQPFAALFAFVTIAAVFFGLFFVLPLFLG